MNFRFKSAVIIYHDSVFGPPHELRDFLLKNNIKFLLCIGHVNRYLKNNPVKNSYFELYKNGKLVTKKQSKVIIKSEAIQYLIDSYLTFCWTTIFIPEKIDYFIGLGNLNIFIGILFNKFHKVKKTIYYVIDYVPQRFPNKIFNFIYHKLDKFCAEKASITWNYAQSMIDARNSKHHKIFQNQIVVPNGIHIRKDIIQPFSKINPHQLVYIGTLSEEHGLQLTIEALATIKVKIPTITLKVIGDGIYKKELVNLVNKFNLAGQVEFLGRVNNQIETDKIITKSVLGIATYSPENKLVFTTEPGKVKRYFACGVPVIITDVGGITKDIIKYQNGFVIPYTVEGFTKAVLDFINKPSTILEYRTNALTYVSNFTWDAIFSKAFLFLLNHENK
jgi:glycosyltransferase involved in cell wall biosynthesis